MTGGWGEWEPGEGKERRRKGEHLKQRVGQEASPWTSRMPMWLQWWGVGEEREWSEAQVEAGTIVVMQSCWKAKAEKRYDKVWVFRRSLQDPIGSWLGETRVVLLGGYYCKWYRSKMRVVWNRAMAVEMERSVDFKMFSLHWPWWITEIGSEGDSAWIPGSRNCVNGQAHYQVQTLGGVAGSGRKISNSAKEMLNLRVREIYKWS